MDEKTAALFVVTALSSGVIGYLRGLKEQSFEARQVRILDSECPEWRQIVGWSPDGTIDRNSPYRKWLREQPDAYQFMLNTSNSAKEILRSIRAFQARSGGIRRVS